MVLGKVMAFGRRVEKEIVFNGVVEVEVKFHLCHTDI